MADEIEEQDDFVLPWRAVLAPINVESGDRRIFDEGSITWRDLPLPLRWVTSDSGGHANAVRVGNITHLEERDGQIVGEGTFYLDREEADKVIGMLAESRLGVSVDLDSMEAEPRNEDGSEFDFETWDGKTEPVLHVTKGRISALTIVDIPAFAEAYIELGSWADEDTEGEYDEEYALKDECEPCAAAAALEKAHDEMSEEEFAAHVEALFAPGTKDGPGWITNPRETQRLRRYWTRGAGAAKIRWGAPGDFNRCRRQLAKYVNPLFLAGTCANLHKVATGTWPGRHAITASGSPAPAFTLVASAAPALPKAEWFLDPEFDGPTPLTIEGDHIYGHLALWNTCHMGLGASVGSNGCITAPSSDHNYAYFRTGLVETDQGDIPVGHITMGTGHAGLSLRAQATMAHYDNTGTVVADVVTGEDAHGIWFSGAIRPEVTDEERRTLKAATLSGDWRIVGNSQELVAALAVNVPGFPIPRLALAASGGVQTALVASGIVHPQKERTVQPNEFTVEALSDAFVAAMEKREAQRREREQTMSRLRSTVADKIDPEQAERLNALRRLTMEEN